VKHVDKMREIVHIQAGQCGNQIGAKVTANCSFEKSTKILKIASIGLLLDTDEYYMLQV